MIKKEHSLWVEQYRLNIYNKKKYEKIRTKTTNQRRN